MVVKKGTVFGFLCPFWKLFVPLLETAIVKRGTGNCRKGHRKLPKGAQGEANKKGRAIYRPSRLEVLGTTFHARLRVHIVLGGCPGRDDSFHDEIQACELFEGDTKFAFADGELIGGILGRYSKRL